MSLLFVLILIAVVARIWQRLAERAADRRTNVFDALAATRRDERAKQLAVDSHTWR